MGLQSWWRNRETKKKLREENKKLKEQLLGQHKSDVPSVNVDPGNDTYCYATCLNSNWYRDQGKKMKYVIWDKLKKIWAIIRNKDFYYSEILMTRKDFETFREYINEVDGSNE